MGLVTGSANALVCALAAARNELLRRQGYDIRERGLRNAPKIRVVLGAGAHATVKTALMVLGFGAAELEIFPTDDMGRMRPDALPALDAGSSGFAVPIAYSRYILDLNSVIIEADARFEEITGYPVSEAVGHMTQLDLIPMEDRGFYLLQVSEQFTHGSMVYLRHAIQRKDGERIQVACYGRRYFDSAVKGFKNEIIIFRL